MDRPPFREMFPKTEAQAKVFLVMLGLLVVAVFGALLYFGVSLKSLHD